MIEYVLMNDAHVPQVAALESMCFRDPWSLKSIASELKNPLSVWVVACDGDTLVGYVGSQTVIDESDMMNLAVDPAYRGQGIGAQLVHSLIEHLVLRGSRCLTLEVRASNDPAIRLYTKLGFTQVGLRPRYYANPREDACILRKEWSL